MELDYIVPEEKRLRVIVDTDAACEADDPYAIAHALMTKKFEVKAILAEHFNSPGSTKKSYDEIVTILKAMSIQVPVYMGEEEPLDRQTGDMVSPAVRFLIEEALRPEEKTLYVLCLGAITNVAKAMKECPDIISRMTVVWIGGQDYNQQNPNIREFNAGNDIEAANLVLHSQVKLWQIPMNVYGSMRIGLAELQKKVLPCGEIGKHLFYHMTEYNCSAYAGWTMGESWTLGDSPAVAVAMDPCCGTYIEREAPLVLPDTTYREMAGAPMIRVYTCVDSRFVLEDFMSKLQLLYCE